MPEAPVSSFLRPGFLTAGLATMAGLIVSVVLALLASGTPDGLLGPARTGVRAWLVAQGSGLDVAGTDLGLVPVGATALVVALTAVVAARVVTEPLDGPGPYAATVAGTSGVLAAILSALTDGGEVGTSVVRAAFGAFAVGGAGAALGATVPHGRLQDLWFTDRADVRAVLRGAGWGVLALAGSSAALLALLLTLHVDRAADLWAVLDPGVGGAIALAVVCLLAVPTLVLWTASVLIGPGFVLGTDTSVDLSGAQLGPVPGLPVLAALPDPGAFGGWVVALGLVPLLAGALAGWRTPVVGGAEGSLAGRVGHGALAGALAGLAVGLAVGLSGGSIGPGRMADAGPPVLSSAAVAVPVLAVGGAIGALLAHYRGTRAQPSRDRTPRRPRLWQRHQPPGAARRGD